MPRIIDYAYLARDVYDRAVKGTKFPEDRVGRSQLLSWGWMGRDDLAPTGVLGCGFFARAYVNNSSKPASIVVAFRGTEPDTWEDVVTDVSLGFPSETLIPIITGVTGRPDIGVAVAVGVEVGVKMARFFRLIPPSQTQSSRIFLDFVVNALRKRQSEYSVSATGHSLGGLLAIHAAADYPEMNVVTFNANGVTQPLGGVIESSRIGMQTDVKKMMKKKFPHVLNIRAKSDVVSLLGVRHGRTLTLPIAEPLWRSHGDTTLINYLLNNRKIADSEPDQIVC
ncbi:MAG: hypothetical protein H7833_06110 [Magnetococcus sp. DMHC-1]